MYTVFHAGIFYDGRQSTYCRPAYFESVREATGFKGHLAHVGWPWYDECVAVLNTTTGLFETATTLGHIVQEGSLAREEYRNMIFYGNAFSHWQNAIHEPQNPRPAPEPIEVPNAHRGH